MLTTELATTELAIHSGDVRLAGTLVRPAADTPAAAVLLIAGSGPLDRDGNHRRLRLDISAQLASSLADAGIASLRYDRRGVGGSGGSFLAAGLQDNIADAAAALEVLRRQRGVDPARVFLVGHSEGAIIATSLLGARAPVAGAVLLAPTARRGDEVLRWQAEQLATDLPWPVRALLRVLRVDLVARVSKNHDRLRATTTDVARMGLVRVNARWFREFLAHDPREDLRRIAVPILAVTGGKDLQAPPQDLTSLARLVPSEVETVVLDDLSHILRSQAGAPSLRSYRKDVSRPVDARLLTLVGDWLTRHASPDVLAATART